MTKRTVLPRRPVATDDIEKGKIQLDESGYTVHEGLLSDGEVERLRDRLEEQAFLECEQGVATYRLAGAGPIGDRRLGGPPECAKPVWQAVLALPNKGRPFIDLAMNETVMEYGRHLFGGIHFYMANLRG